MPVAIPPDQRRLLGLPPQTPARGGLAPVVPNVSPLNLLEEKVRVASASGQVRFLPWLDNYTNETAAMRRCYPEMLKVGVVKSALLSKIFSVVSLPLQMNATGRTRRERYIADFAKDGVLTINGGMRKIGETTLLPCMVYGHSISEKLLKTQPRGKWTGFTVWDKLKGKDTENGPQLKLVTDEYLNVTAVRAWTYNGSEDLAPEGFVILNYLGLFESPAGMSDFRAVYAPYWRRDTVQKLRVIHLEKYTSPAMMGFYTDPKDKREIEAALEQFKSNTWASFPEGTRIEAMQIAMRGEAEFAQAVRDYDEEIALAIAGAFLQMLTSNGGGGDMRGDSETQKSTAQLFVWHLASILTQAINEQMIPDIIEPNFAGADYPTATLGSVDDTELTASAQLDDILVNRLSMPLSMSERAEYYGRQLATDPNDVIKPAQQAAPPGGGGLPFANVEGEQRRPFSDADHEFCTEEFCQSGPNAGKPGPCPKGGAAHVEGAVSRVRGIVAGGAITPAHVHELSTHLAGMTRADIISVKRQLGVKAGGKKADLAKKVAERALTGGNPAVAAPTPVPAGPPPVKTPAKPKDAPNPDVPDGARPTLEKTEADALHTYTTSAYRAINGPLRSGGTLTGQNAEVHAQLQNAFARATDFPEPVTVYRGLALPPAEAKKFLADLQGRTASGQPVTWNGYQSTATDSTAADYFLKYAPKGTQPIEVRIAAKRGLDARLFSDVPDENELLLNHASKYRVKSVTKSKGRHIVELEQL